ncbi:MAG: hypothetical protein EB100_03100, partial [Crocinitomicaceae bacterium]|nr:hypothetical protein [Crocinitomicaceae bacterium]
IDLEKSKGVTRDDQNKITGFDPSKVNQPLISSIQSKMDDLKSKTRKREVVQARQISMFFSKKLTKASLASIGANCGGKDHATVLHACRTVLNLSETDKQFKSYLDDLEKKLSIQ